MAKRTKTQFKTLWGSGSSTFADNTTGDISAEDIRDFAEDIADSFPADADGMVLSVSTSTGTITLNFDSTVERVFVGNATFATAKDIALINDTYASIFEFVFEITNVAAELEFPTEFVMNDVRWEVSVAKTWTPDAVGKYKAKAVWDGTDWLLDISQPYA
jgi:hypothetical protein